MVEKSSSDRQFSSLTFALSLLGIFATTLVTGLLIKKANNREMVIYKEIEDDDDTFTGVAKSRRRHKRRLMRKSEKNPLLEVPEEETRSPPNIHLKILPNSGGGDCLFYCFQQALDNWLGYDEEHNVASLRKLISESVTEEHYEYLKTIYQAAESLVNEGDKSFETFQLFEDYVFMKDVHSMEDLKKVVLTRFYWGDEFAIRILEEKTGIQTIIIKPVDQKPGSKRSGNFELARKIGEKERDPRIVWKPHILLLLKNQHYQLAQLNGEILHNPTKLPIFLQPHYVQNAAKQITLKPVPKSAESLTSIEEEARTMIKDAEDA